MINFVRKTMQMSGFGNNYRSLQGEKPSAGVFSRLHAARYFSPCHKAHALSFSPVIPAIPSVSFIHLIILCLS